ncbi:class I SAM-dependent methyltransferase [Enterococcus alcedinis]|uniref:Methyltransferase n=1 Tax=Enterococcus alcedinis TaxID=1274384 RepID=A0A917N489_9ENTE|nr:class I SAM-dependent methyltransferase [Enterococcus alcedinis]MBP2101795.1 ubiquinone/menaquinone biosynthesis C-methylase UbiE [Enterococcus alcedinis]GGI65358.1 methyltransferase [Enterococcus alcedinis]
MFDSYGPLCTEVYDFTKPVGHSINGDIEYYLARLANTKGKILEAAVGSGRFLIPLLEQGLDVDGFDASSAMLDSCQKRCHERHLSPRLYEADFATFSFNQVYEAIVVPTGSFCLIESLDDAQQTLLNFYQHLEKNGRLIIDLMLPSDWQTGTISTSTFSLSADEGILLENKAIAIDWVEQTTLSYLTYEKWRQGKQIASELQKFCMRWYGLEEFKNMLEKIGFTAITCSADYQYNQQPTSNHSIFTFEAIKK